MISIKKSELFEMMESKILPGNIIYWVSGVKTIDEANKIAKISYNYRSKYKRKLISLF